MPFLREVRHHKPTGRAGRDVWLKHGCGCPSMMLAHLGPNMEPQIAGYLQVGKTINIGVPV